MYEISSGGIDQLADALSKAQGEYPEIPKTKEVDFTYNGKRTHYWYADLRDVIRAVQPALSKYGLAHAQIITPDAGGTFIVTKVMHKSGQWIRSFYPLVIKAKEQETGTAITYARKYALTSILGVQAEDDNDGDTAPPAENAKKDPPFMTEERMKEIQKLFDQSKWPKPHFIEQIKFIGHANAHSLSAFNAEEFQRLKLKLQDSILQEEASEQNNAHRE